MKNKLLLLLVLCSLSLTSSLFAQDNYYIGDIPLTNIDVEYIEIIPQGRGLNTGCILFVDFGQPSSSLSRNDTRLKNFANKEVIFNSRMDALNFMLSQGFEYVSSYTTSDDGTVRFFYLLRKAKRD